MANLVLQTVVKKGYRTINEAMYLNISRCHELRAGAGGTGTVLNYRELEHHQVWHELTLSENFGASTLLGAYTAHKKITLTCTHKNRILHAVTESFDVDKIIYVATDPDNAYGSIVWYDSERFEPDYYRVSHTPAAIAAM